MHKSEYLKNDFCEFQISKPIDYNKKKIIMATSLFKMKEGGYKEFKQYLEGIKSMNEFAEKNNLEVRVFIDETINKDQEIMDYLNKFEKTTLVLYSCPDFWIQNHHVSVFGTLLRFFPLFKFPNNDAKYCMMMDADENPSMFDLYDLLLTIKEHKLQKKIYLAFLGNFYGKKKLTLQINDQDYHIPYHAATRILGVKHIPTRPFVKYLEKLKLYMDEKTRPEKLLTDFHDAVSKQINIRCENNICYGVDEFFTNHILTKYLIKKKKPFCYRATYTIVSFYYKFHPYKFDHYPRNLNKNEYNKVFNEYMKEIGYDKYSYKEMNKHLNQGTFHEENKNEINDFLNKFGKKMTQLLKKIDEKKDYRIYNKYDMNYFNLFDYDKYCAIQDIRFFNLDQENIVVSELKYKGI